ncbi:MAG TPA: acyltransferase domain-containing protein [Stellaceae bacterium]|nr:acyltransferase domain-containing protein [Stellaceae bacterium]
MFALTGDAPEAANLFAHAATLLGGRDPREMAQTDPDDTLHQNRVGQILCTLQALAATATLRGAWPRRLIIAGYSVGEVAAWSVAGLMDATMTLDLVSRRANAMDAPSRPGDGLLFVRGLPYGAVEDLCSRHDAAIAIVNPGDALVLGGPAVALDIIADVAKRMGAARAVRLAVNVASHTPRLAAASSEFRKILDQKLRRNLRRTRMCVSLAGSMVLLLSTSQPA